MRKHNFMFMHKRWSRDKGDTSNFPQVMAHGVAKNKFAHMFSNSLLLGMLKRAGCMPKLQGASA